MSRSYPRFCFTLLLAILMVGGTLAAQQLSKPEDFAGFPIGSDGNLVIWEQIVEYSHMAGAASDRILIEEVGRTTKDLPFLLATISSPRNLSRLEEIRAVQRSLAHPEDLSAEEADRLARTSPAVLLITLNIHSTEIGSSQMALELFYQLATEESEWMQNVLDNVVFLLIPSMNPDGQKMVTEWYNQTKETDHEGASMPWLYHHYVGHDNNRDAFMLTQKESRMLTKILYQDWFPQVFLDEHQMGNSGARIFVPPWTNPINPNVDPLIWSENGLLGFALFTAIHEAGKSGVIYDQTYTSWWQGGFVMEAWWHNMVGLLTEVASVRTASPVEQEKARLGVPPRGPGLTREQLRNRDPKDPIPAPRDVMPRNNYPRPWLGGSWTLRDIVDYELIVTRALLETVANNRSLLIRNQVKMGQRAIAAGKTEKPYAYVFPAGQHDLGARYRLAEALHYAGVEIHQLKEHVEVGGKDLHPGAFVILMAQPFRAFAKDMLEKQTHPNPADFPAGTMRDQPYDVTGWTLPLQMGVKSIQVDEAFEAELVRLEEVPRPAGMFMAAGAKRPRAVQADGSDFYGSDAQLSETVAGHGFVVDPRPNARVLATNRLLKAGAQLSWLQTETKLGGRTLPAGALLVQGISQTQAAGHVASLGVNVSELEGPVRSPRLSLTKPRIGLYQPWTGSMDEGWTRWLLEQYDFEFSTLHNADFKDGDLGDRFDAILFPGDRNRNQIVNGSSSRQTPPEYKGGIGEDGLERLEVFVRNGGTLVLMHRSTLLSMEWPIPLRNALAGLSQNDFSCPGSLLEIQVDTAHPVAFGMESKATAVFSNSAVFDLAPGFSYTNVKVIARYPARNPLQSGWIRGDEHLHNRIAAAEVGYHEGRIVLLGFPVQNRAQPDGTFKLLFNALHLAGASEVPMGRMMPSSGN